MRTVHQYLDKYPIAKDSERLIVGTIHPHDHHNFSVPFFYGNVASIWTILSEAFPTELKKPIQLEGILQFLNKRKIAVSDTIVQCDRKKPSALDQDLIPVELNLKLREEIRNSKVREILFTSGFGRNNAFKLFYVDILGLSITKEIREMRETVLDSRFFGRPVQLTILYSPSGASNMGIARSERYLKNKQLYKDSPTPVHDFKVDYYKEKFGGK
ncbi:MAG: hypothetical protein WAP48_11055 [Sediminibacterium sp.]